MTRYFIQIIRYRPYETVGPSKTSLLIMIMHWFIHIINNLGFISLLTLLVFFVGLKRVEFGYATISTAHYRASWWATVGEKTTRLWRPVIYLNIWWKTLGVNLTRFKHFKSEFKIRKIFEQFNILKLEYWKVKVRSPVLPTYWTVVLVGLFKKLGWL